MKDLKFVNLHAHSGVGSPFDGFGYPQEHMDYAFENGCEALALTDHGNMNGFAYQVLHARKMMKEKKDFKPIFGVEAYFIPDVVEWREELEKHKADKKMARKIEKDQSGTNIENEGESKGSSLSTINRSRHLVLIAMNETGLQNIFKLVSTSYTQDYFYRKPRIDYELLSKYSDGVIGLSACLGGVYAGCYWQHRDEGSEAVLEAMREVTRRMVGIFGDRWYGELQWNNVPEQHDLNKYIIQVCDEFDVKLVSTADSHYPTPDAWKDRELYKRLGWLGRGKPEWLDMELPTSVQEMEYELYPKNAEQMWDSYRIYSEHCGVDYDDEIVRESIQESYRIAFDRVDAFLPDNTVRLPSFVVPAGYTDDGYLKHLSMKGLISQLGKEAFASKQEYQERLDHELSVIADRGFSKYFLTMKAISDKTNDTQLSGPGRGSAAGSLVAYALGITQIDPIKYGLLFSRFLRSDATDYPDIDYDVSDPMVLKEALIEEWGSSTVVPISNWNTMQLRSLLKDISKFYEIEFKEVNQVTSRMLAEATPIAKKAHGIKAGVYTPTFEEVMEYSETLQAFFRKYPHVKDHVEALQGSYRSCSRHAGGVVIGEELDKFMPLISSKGVRQTPWSEGQNVRQLEPMGFIKFDILGLSTLRMIEECIVKILQRHHNIEEPTHDQIKDFYDKHLHPDSIDLNNPEVYKNIFHKEKWIGIFQFTEAGAQRFAAQVKPNNIIDLAAITSIYRPGPLSAGVDKSYTAAVRDPGSVKYLNDDVRRVTKETHGFLIFQEQIAQLAYDLGDGITMDEANLLRKILTKKGTGKGFEIKEKIHKKFIDGCSIKGISAHKAEKLWQTFEYFSGYGFNKSHAVSYSVISFQCAWLCNYYNAEWVAAFLDKEPESRKEKAINLAKQHGYNIQPLNINKSEASWTILDETTLVAPLTTIKGLGNAAMQQIIDNRPFASVEEFIFNENITYSKLNKRALDVLCRSGAMSELIDERFTGARHFWSAVCVDRPRKKKNLDDNIEKYAPEGEFSEEEKIEFLASLTGIFPISLVLTTDVQRRLDELYIPPISEYDPDLMVCWCIPREVTVKKSRNGKDFMVVKVIDSNSVQKTIRCWSIDKAKDKIHINRPYMLKPRYTVDWGFSTYGRVNGSWVLLG
jgi:DNA polymerase-3 subunit alpha